LTNSNLVLVTSQQADFLCKLAAGACPSRSHVRRKIHS